jgi:hypothetical protein
MKHKYLTVFLLVVLVSSFPLTSTVAQRSPIELYGVSPSEGFPDEYLELLLMGEGFLKVEEIVAVEIEGIEVRDFWVESNNEIGADVYIPEFAEPGPRTVIVHGSMGQNEPVEAVLREGFFVLEREEVPPVEPSPVEPPPVEPPPDEPPYEPQYVPPDDDFPWWILILVLGVLGVVGIVVVTLAVVLYRANLRRTWQQQASSQELPKSCHPSTYINRREKIVFKPGRWKVIGMKVSLFDSVKKERGKTYAVPGDLVSKIDKAARRRLLQGEDDKLREEIAEMAEELGALVVAWQAISEKGKDAYLEARMEGGTAEAKFARYHCVGQPGQWKKVLEWKAKLKTVDTLPASLRAPLEGESQQAYQVFLEQQLDGYLTGAVKEAARLL